MSTTALLVIDIQRGAFDGILCPPIDRPARLLTHAQSLVAAARTGGSPVIYVQHCESTAGDPFQEGTPHWQFPDQLLPMPADPVIRKRASSAFENTELERLLKRLQVKHLVLCGLQSEFCVTNTSRSALDLGYSVHVAGDGHSTWPSEGRTADAISAGVNDDLKARGARVLPTARLAAKLRAQKKPNA